MADRFESKEHDRGSIRLLLVFILGLAFLFYLIFPVSFQTPEQGRLTRCLNKIRNLAQAVNSYEVEHERYPPPGMLLPKSRRGLSWRVAILPYIEQENLYRLFRLDEPWDSEHNLSVAEKLNTDIFQCSVDKPRYKVIKGHKILCTNYVMITGPGTVGGENGELLTLQDISGHDGASNTLMLVEVCGDNRPAWTEPVDIHIDDLARGVNAEEGMCIGSGHPTVWIAARCDTTSWKFHEDIKPDTLRILAGWSDGEAFELP